MQAHPDDNDVTREADQATPSPLRHIRVVVADDQPLMRRAIAELIAEDPCIEVVGQAADGKEALALCDEHQPEVVLTDLDMPVMNGVELISTLQGREIACLALTTFSSMDWVVSALRAGASGYLIKDAAPDEIIQAVQQVLDDTMVLSPAVIRLLADQVTRHPDPVRPEPHAEAPKLSPREKQVLDLLAGGLSNREIAEELYLSEGSVKLHLSRAIDRLGVRDRVQLLVRAVELGLVQPKLRRAPGEDRYR